MDGWIASFRKIGMSIPMKVRVNPVLYKVNDDECQIIVVEHFMHRTGRGSMAWEQEPSQVQDTNVNLKPS